MKRKRYRELVEIERRKKMKEYISYGKKVGLTVIDHEDIKAVEFKYGDCTVWYDIDRVRNSFKRKDIEEIMKELVLKSWMALDTIYAFN